MILYFLRLSFWTTFSFGGGQMSTLDWTELVTSIPMECVAVDLGNRELRYYTPYDWTGETIIRRNRIKRILAFVGASVFILPLSAFVLLGLCGGTQLPTSKPTDIHAGHSRHFADSTPNCDGCK